MTTFAFEAPPIGLPDAPDVPLLLDLTGRTDEAVFWTPQTEAAAEQAATTQAETEREAYWRHAEATHNPESRQETVIFGCGRGMEAVASDAPEVRDPSLASHFKPIYDFRNIIRQRLASDPGNTALQNATEYVRPSVSTYVRARHIGALAARLVRHNTPTRVVWMGNSPLIDEADGITYPTSEARLANHIARTEGPERDRLPIQVPTMLEERPHTTIDNFIGAARQILNVPPDAPYAKRDLRGDRAIIAAEAPSVERCAMVGRAVLKHALGNPKVRIERIRNYPEPRGAKIFETATEILAYGHDAIAVGAASTIHYARGIRAVFTEQEKPTGHDYLDTLEKSSKWVKWTFDHFTPAQMLQRRAAGRKSRRPR